MIDPLRGVTRFPLIPGLRRPVRRHVVDVEDVADRAIIRRRNVRVDARRAYAAVSGGVSDFGQCPARCQRVRHEAMSAVVDRDLGLTMLAQGSTRRDIPRPGILPRHWFADRSLSLRTYEQVARTGSLSLSLRVPRLQISQRAGIPRQRHTASLAALGDGLRHVQIRTPNAGGDVTDLQAA